MKKHRAQFGFSLMEVLVAVGVLAIGLLFVTGTFPIGIFLTAAATEQSIAPVVADEAFAKIAVYCTADANGEGIQLKNLSTIIQKDFVHDWNDTAAGLLTSKRKFTRDECRWPSDPNITQGTYHWTALMRRVTDGNDGRVQVTVWVTRDMGQSVKYWHHTNGLPDFSTLPETKASDVTVVAGNANQLTVSQTTGLETITEKCTILDAGTGELYRVIEWKEPVITLDRPWEGKNTAVVWTVPQPQTSGKTPCVGVYQRVMKF